MAALFRQDCYGDFRSQAVREPVTGRVSTEEPGPSDADDAAADRFAACGRIRRARSETLPLKPQPRLGVHDVARRLRSPGRMDGHMEEVLDQSVFSGPQRPGAIGEHHSIFPLDARQGETAGAAIITGGR
ncbi:MAG: hypothetical protein LBT54_04230 [Bifidobacteriaceae bacterium]|nr:hypothetical protein [Bifidobacteriaceae bacterium]